MRLLGSVLFAASGLLVVAIAGNGCGGDKFTAASDDAGSAQDGAGDTSSGDASSVDASIDGPVAQCVLPPNGVGNEHDFCNFEASILSRCAYCDSCEQLDANDCVGLGDALSANFKSSLISCQSSLRCDPIISNYAKDPCVLAKLDSAQRTMTENAVKAAYCGACPTNTAACTGFFDFSGEASTGGLGIWAVLFNDSLAQQVAMSCSANTSPKCDAGSYNFCAALVLCGKNGAPYSHCTKGLCR